MTSERVVAGGFRKSPHGGWLVWVARPGMKHPRYEAAGSYSRARSLALAVAREFGYERVRVASLNMDEYEVRGHVPYVAR